MKTISQSEKWVLLPEILAHEIVADSIILTLRIPENLRYFVGHFEQIPIVPGVVQIQWAVRFAEAYLMPDKVFKHMEAIKFKELMLSGRPLQLSLRYYPDDGKLEFRYHSEAVEYSSGRIYFHDDSI
ncbi:MAG: ApeI family dehydratase [Gammaproteobacteria bacterium]